MAIAVCDGAFKNNWFKEAQFIQEEHYGIGLLHMVSITESLYNKHNIIYRAISTSCDGLEATKKAIDIDSDFSCQSNHFEIISSID